MKISKMSNICTILWYVLVELGGSIHSGTRITIDNTGRHCETIQVDIVTVSIGYYNIIMLQVKCFASGSSTGKTKWTVALSSIELVYQLDPPSPLYGMGLGCL